MDSDGLGEVAAGVKVCGTGWRPGGWRGRASPECRRVPGDRDQGGPFGIQPGPRRSGVGHRRGGSPWPRGYGADGAVRRGRRVSIAAASGVQVVVEQPGQRCPPILLAVDVYGEFGGVAAQQVVHAVAARPGRLDQVRAGQQRQALGGPSRWSCAVSAAAAYWSKSGAGCRPEQPERTGGIARPGAGRTRRRRPAPRCGGRRRRPAGPAAAAGRPAHSARSARDISGRAAASSAATRSASGSRAALRRQCRGRAGFGIDGPADQRAQQARSRRARGSRSRSSRAAPCRATRPAQRVTAGHHHHAGRGAGQQRPDLLHLAGVVQHHQHPPVGQQAAVPGGPVVWLRRDVLAGHAQRAQEPG